VDVEVSNNRLEHVRLSGDFFLEPDTALEDIDAALSGMPADADAAQLASAISAGLDPTVSMIGFSPEAAGIAVRRALGKTSGWDDHTFDVSDAVTMDPVRHVALDQVMPQQVAAGLRPPTLRFWEWDAPLVVIGSF